MLVAALAIGALFVAHDSREPARSLRACGDHERNARALRSASIAIGVRLATFTIGAGLAALAGVLLTPLTSVDPNMGVAWLIGAFMLVLVARNILLQL